MSSVSDIKLIRTDTTLDLSQKARSDGQNGPRQPRVLHGSCTEDMVVLLQTRLPCPRMPACKCTHTNSKPSFLTAVVTAACDCSTATNHQTSNPLFQFPYKRANFSP